MIDIHSLYRYGGIGRKNKLNDEGGGALSYKGRGQEHKLTTPPPNFCQPATIVMRC